MAAGNQFNSALKLKRIETSVWDECAVAVNMVMICLPQLETFTALNVAPERRSIDVITALANRLERNSCSSHPSSKHRMNWLDGNVFSLPPHDASCVKSRGGYKASCENIMGGGFWSRWSQSNHGNCCTTTNEKNTFWHKTLVFSPVMNFLIIAPLTCFWVHWLGRDDVNPGHSVLSHSSWIVIIESYMAIL